MSTRSCIILNVRKEDIGKKFKFDASKLGKKLLKWDCYGNEIGSEKSKEVTITSPYIGIYCHNDGCIDGVGRVLKEEWLSYEDILNLIVGGWCSVIWDGEVRHYANRKGERWDIIEPIQGKSAKDVQNKIDHRFCYLFKENIGWRWRGYHCGRFIKL